MQIVQQRRLVEEARPIHATAAANHPRALRGRIGHELLDALAPGTGDHWSGGDAAFTPVADDQPLDRFARGFQEVFRDVVMHEKAAG